MDDTVFLETELVIRHMNKSRNRYINDALDFYNKAQQRKILALQLEKESRLVKAESLEVLRDFEMIEHED